MVRVAVIGDVMLDAYYHCDVIGFSPEDDLAPKLAVRSKSYKPGGAANVACCLSKWGSEVGLFGVCGNDFSCETLSNILRREALERVYLYPIVGRPTTCKTRVVTPQSRQAVRVDEECSKDVDSKVGETLQQALSDFHPAIVVVSDYAKGVVTSGLMRFLTEQLSGDVLVVVDPKTPNLGFYRRVFAITPNEHEFAAFKGTDVDPRCEATHLVVTQGSKGSVVLKGNLTENFRVPVRARAVGDPAGCGDAYVAALVQGMCIRNTFREACLLASAAGALAFDMMGVACPKWEQIEEELTYPEYKMKETLDAQG